MIAKQKHIFLKHTLRRQRQSEKALHPQLLRCLMFISCKSPTFSSSLFPRPLFFLSLVSRQTRARRELGCEPLWAGQFLQQRRIRQPPHLFLMSPPLSHWGTMQESTQIRRPSSFLLSSSSYTSRALLPFICQLEFSFHLLYPSFLFSLLVSQPLLKHLIWKRWKEGSVRQTEDQYVLAQ